MNWEIRDGKSDEKKEVSLCKRAVRLPRHIDWGSGLASEGSLQPGPITGLPPDTDVHHHGT